MRAKLIVIAAAFAALWISAPARAQLEKFDLFPGIVTGGAITDVAVTPDDRFVLVLDSSTAMRIVDTWKFGLVDNDTVVFNDTPLSIDVAPTGSHAYIGLESGQIALVALSELYGLVPGDTQAINLIINYEDTGGSDPLDHIAALGPSDGSTGNVYVFAASESGNILYYDRFAGGGTATEENGAAMQSYGQNHATHGHATHGLAAGGTTLFEVYEQSSEQYLRRIRCTGSPAYACETLQTSNIEGTYDLWKAAADRGHNDYIVSFNDETGQLTIFPSPIPPSPTPDTVSPSFMAIIEDFAILPGGTDYDSMLIAAGYHVIDKGRLFASVIDPSVPSFGNTQASWLDAADGDSIGSTLLSVAASSGQDRYAYVGGVDGGEGKLHVFTANPWVVILSATESATVDSGYTVTDGFSVEFTIDDGDTTHVDVSYAFYTQETFKGWDSPILSSDSDTIEADPTINRIEWVSASSLAECENVITVTATDANGLVGRDAVVVTKDTVPPAQSFNLGFGDRFVEFSFSAQDLCDLDYYSVYYGTTTTAADYADLQSSQTYYGTYTPEAGESVVKRIEDLVNFTTYYVWIVTVDQGGKASVNGPLSATPQPTFSLTDLTDEDGGVNCMGSVAGEQRGGPGGLWILLLPFAAAGVLRLASRLARGRARP